MTDSRKIGRDEKEDGREWDGLTAADLPIVERYAAARTAAAAVMRDHSASHDEDTRRHLVLAALVAALDAVGDVPVLLQALLAARLRAANLAAAGRAAVAAQRDGEADPLYYVRDELMHDVDAGPDAAVTP
ncbi:hypothetical protein [Pseudonocardia humida]|uniref:Uncharacterized protein n=1 Tax=Pseudonocardia humida TaxID=2800819 RepID=A0ABT1A2Z0_9PSEU|nr:hypothetical protein [Pseudonocardia humida]MCO1657362.1 hypothetical protein [Pseudonocardia humida]